MQPIRFGWAGHGHKAIEQAVIANMGYRPVKQFLQTHQAAIQHASADTDVVDRGPHHYINLTLGDTYKTSEHKIPTNFKDMTAKDRAKFALTQYIWDDQKNRIYPQLFTQLKQRHYPIEYMNAAGDKNIFVTVNQRWGTLVDQLTSLIKLENRNHASEAEIKRNLTQRVIQSTGRLLHLGSDMHQPQHNSPIHDHKTLLHGREKSSHKLFEHLLPPHDPDYKTYHKVMTRVFRRHNQRFEGMTQEDVRRHVTNAIVNAHLQNYRLLESDYKARLIYKKDLDNDKTSGYQVKLEQLWLPIVMRQMVNAAQSVSTLLTGAWVAAERNQWKQ